MSETPLKKFSEPLMEIIRRWRSVRTYSLRPLPAELKSEIVAYLRRVTCPFGATPRLQLLERAAARKASRARLGTYGFIAGARQFVVAAARKNDPDLPALGYALEDIVLFLTSRGLGTCWLGGTFTQASFARAFALAADEFVPVVASVGYPAKTFRAPIDLLLKSDPSHRSRLGWPELFRDGDFSRPLGPEAAGAFAPALEAVRLAPSASNRQPWRVVRQGRLWHFYLRHDAGYTRRHSFDLQRVDIGIALCHFDLVAGEAGLAGRWIASPPAFPPPPRHEYVRTWEGR